MKIKQTEYQKGKIYKITFNNGYVYVGSTICEIEKRFGEHMNNCEDVVFKNKK